VSRSCVDCGASLPDRRSGKRGALPLRCDPCRSQRNQHRYHRRTSDTGPCVDCGLTVRGRSAQRRCDACRREHAKRWPSRSKSHYLCACGKSRNPAAAKCWTCYSASRKRRPIQVCQTCNRSFQTKRGLSEVNYQRNKYCSRACYFATKKAKAAERLISLTASQVIARAQREAVMAEREAARASLAVARVRSCRCGAVITRRKDGVFCAACSAERRERVIPRAWVRVLGVDHLCPNCGAWFKGYRYAVYCSARCCEQTTKHGRYPALGRVDVEERNGLAELVYLEREARRWLYKHGTNI
jgi:hypothetical protein